MAVILAILIVVCLSGCSKSNANAAPISPSISIDSDNEETAESEAPINSVEVEGIIYTIDSVTLSDTEGDCDVEGYNVENGQYIDLEDGIVLASDYQSLTINYTIENTTDRAFGYVNVMDAYLPDGYKLPQLAVGNISDLGLAQIPSHSFKSLSYVIIADKTVTIDSVVLNYTHMDYDEEYWEDLGNAIFGNAGPEDFEKYEKEMKDIEFAIDVTA